MDHVDRILDARNMVDGRGLLEASRIFIVGRVTEGLIEPGTEQGIDESVRGSASIGDHDVEDRRHAAEVDATRVEFGRVDQTHERRVAAIRCSVDADPLRIRVALLDGPGDGVGDVILHLQTPLLVRALLEGFLDLVD